MLQLSAHGSLESRIFHSLFPHEKNNFKVTLDSRYQQILIKFACSHFFFLLNQIIFLPFESEVIHILNFRFLPSITNPFEGQKRGNFAKYSTSEIVLNSSTFISRSVLRGSEFNYRTAINWRSRHTTFENYRNWIFHLENSVFLFRKSNYRKKIFLSRNCNSRESTTFSESESRELLRENERIFRREQWEKSFKCVRGWRKSLALADKFSDSHERIFRVRLQFFS